MTYPLPPPYLHISPPKPYPTLPPQTISHPVSHPSNPKLPPQPHITNPHPTTQQPDTPPPKTPHTLHTQFPYPHLTYPSKNVKKTHRTSRPPSSTSTFFLCHQTLTEKKDTTTPSDINLQETQRRAVQDPIPATVRTTSKKVKKNNDRVVFSHHEDIGSVWNVYTCTPLCQRIYTYF